MSTVFATKTDLLEAIQADIDGGSRDVALVIAASLLDAGLVHYENEQPAGFKGYEDIDDATWERHVRAALEEVEEADVRFITLTTESLSNKDLANRLDFMASSPTAYGPDVTRITLLEAAKRLAKKTRR